MNSGAGARVGTEILAGIHWILNPNHIIIATLVIAGVGGGLMILNDVWRARCDQKSEEKTGRGAKTTTEKELAKKLRRF